MPKTTANVEAYRQGTRAALANARRLLDDAGLLLETGSPSGCSLSVLAMEEAAKADMWRRAVEVKDLEHEVADLTWHTNKMQHSNDSILKTIFYMSVVERTHQSPDEPYGDEDVGDAEVRVQQQNERMNDLKKRGLYADVIADGVKDPASIPDEERRDMFNLAGQYVGHVVEAARGYM